MKTPRCLAFALLTLPVAAQEAPPELVVGRLIEAQQFLAGQIPHAASLSLTLKVESATGSFKTLSGKPLDLQLEPPNRFAVTTELNGPVSLRSDGTKLWIHVPSKNLLLEGDPGVPRFSTRPDSTRAAAPPSLQLPIQPAQIGLAAALVNITEESAAPQRTITLSAKPEAIDSLGFPQGTLRLSLDSENWPETVTYNDGHGNSATVRITSRSTGPSLPPESWKPATDQKPERVALVHLTKFLETAIAGLGAGIPSLPPATGTRQLVATHGKGRLEMHDGTRVLFLSGTPEEMGAQQGTLLRSEIRRVVDRILYGVGVGSSFDKGRWFFGEIEEAVRRTGPFVDPRHTREMDAIAAAAGLDREEVRLSNFFPELFHCSGFALLGKATEGARIYHGRVLDYLRGVGLEENAVVAVIRPDEGNAWVNLSYAGFVGSVTAMNEKQLAIGEMGGRGEGHWDGKPMAQLMRDVMEKTSTIDEALAHMRSTPRTCEYYYVLSDAKSHRACGIKATPDTFEVVWSGEAHPQLADPISDTVVLSADDRYKELVRRVREGFGKFTADSAIQLMTRPVCMTSNIQSVLFAPDTLDFWVANADGQNVASATRFTKYNLRALLDSTPAAQP
jgi:outer membrane lipoprotein-sorting protein